MTEKGKMDTAVFLQFESFDFDNNVSFQEGWQSIVERLGGAVTGETLTKARAFFFSKQVKPLDLEQYLLWRKVKDSGEELCCGKDSTSAVPANSAFSDNGRKIVNHVPEATQSESIPSSSESTASISISGQDLKTETSSCTADSVAYTSESGQDGISDTSTTNLNDADRSLRCDTESSPVSVTDAKSEATQDGKLETVSFSSVSDNSTCEHSGSGDSESQPSLSLAEIAELIQNQQPIPGLLQLDVQPTNSSPTPSALERRPKPWQTRQEGSKSSIIDTS